MKKVYERNERPSTEKLCWISVHHFADSPPSLRGRKRAHDDAKATGYLFDCESFVHIFHVSTYLQGFIIECQTLLQFVNSPTHTVIMCGIIIIIIMYCQHPHPPIYLYICILLSSIYVAAKHQFTMNFRHCLHMQFTRLFDRYSNYCYSFKIISRASNL